MKRLAARHQIDQRQLRAVIQFCEGGCFQFPVAHHDRIPARFRGVRLGHRTGQFLDHLGHLNREQVVSHTSEGRPVQARALLDSLNTKER